jgi:pyridinium-3,5-biscarboxylic acid mononucleotide sulfurtransferase
VEQWGSASGTGPFCDWQEATLCASWPWAWSFFFNLSKPAFRYTYGMNSNDKRGSLEGILRDMGSVMVAYSGGVDSALVAYLANRAIPGRMLAVTAKSASVAEDELTHAIKFAVDHDIPHKVILTDELNDPRYAANPTNRCFFCKEELYSRLVALKSEMNFAHLADGSHAEDSSSERPGMLSAKNHGVRSPLREAGLGKADIRSIAKDLELEIWDKPASPCLSSRVPHGIAITPEKLHQVDRAEQVLRGLGFRVFRVRHHEELARIEVARDELPRLLDLGLFDHVVRELRRVGYRHVTLDMQGYPSST